MTHGAEVEAPAAPATDPEDIPAAEFGAAAELDTPAVLGDDAEGEVTSPPTAPDEAAAPPTPPDEVAPEPAGAPVPTAPADPAMGCAALLASAAPPDDAPPEVADAAGAEPAPALPPLAHISCIDLIMASASPPSVECAQEIHFATSSIF